MKVFGICPGRANGNTEIMMKEAFKSIVGVIPDAVCEFVRLQDAFIKPCTGCENCMIHHLQGDFDFRCKFGSDRDHFQFIENKIREADAVIVSAPAYNLLPPGNLITFLNKMHASGDYREVVHAHHKISAAFTIGGTDWTNFVLAATTMIAMEISGSYDGVVDKCHFDYTTAVGAVVLDPEKLERMHVLGENVARAMLAKAAGEPWGYQGDPGLCPDCHGSLLEVRADGVYCPQCNTLADVAVVGGELQATFSEANRAKNRWSPDGIELHNRRIGIQHGRAHEGQKQINTARREYASFMQPVELPALTIYDDIGAREHAMRKS